MKKYLSLLVALFATLFTVNSFAYDAPPKPANGGYVLDEVGKLSQSEIAQLNRKIETLKQNTKNEFGVAIIQSTGGADISDVGQTIFRSWGVGNAQLNNGVLLVIAMAEHKTRIQTGKGVEGDLPDLKANDILQLQLKPLLKQGKFYEGIDTALNAISTSIDDRTKQVAALPPASPSANKALQSSDNSSSGSGWIALLLLGGAGLIGLVFFLVSRANRREEEERQEYEDRRAAELQQRRDADRARRLASVKTSPEVPAHKANYVAPIVTGVAAGGLAAGVVAAVAVSEAEKARHKREEDARRRRDDEERTQRENRRREEDSRSSYTPSYSSPSYTSYDSGGGGGGGFGGGDSGGGGSSGDF